MPIITDVFDAAAAEMAKLWGVPGFRFVSMPHPLANLRPAAVAERADALTEKVLALLREGQPT